MKQTQKTSRLLIADRSLLFCRGMRTVLSAEKDLKIVETASTGEEALAKVRLFTPDVLVIDAELLRSNDPQWTIALRQAMANGSILALTENDNDDLLAQAIAVGARGYMLKNSSPAHLAEGIRQVAFIDNSHTLPIAKIVPDLKALAAQHETKLQAPVLTTRESEVVRLLAEGKTVRNVANELLLSTKTVEAHKLNLMRKLDIHDRTALCAYAMKHGMVPAMAGC